jgi:hypothetical protein
MHKRRHWRLPLVQSDTTRSNVWVVVLSNASTLIGVDDIGIHLLNPTVPLANPEPPKQHTETPLIRRSSTTT